MAYLLKKSRLKEWLLSLKDKFEVIAPIRNATGATCFSLYNGQQLYLEALTDYSAKEYLQPHKEKEFLYKRKNKSVEIIANIDRKKRLIFGLRPCDLHAIAALDKLFIEYYRPDLFYQERRKNTVLIGMLCRAADENCFCESLGTDKPVGHDLLFIEEPNSDYYYVEVASEQGKKLLSEDFAPTKDPRPLSSLHFTKKLNTKQLKERLDSNFFHSVWKEEAERCLSCTACTQVCPSCYCYSTEENFLVGTADSERHRYWDSCHLLQFTRVSGDYIFRKSRESRLRQFVMHKLSYFQENHSMLLCTGCGRCIAACPVNIDLVRIANSIRSVRK